VCNITYYPFRHNNALSIVGYQHSTGEKGKKEVFEPNGYVKFKTKDLSVTGGVGRNGSAAMYDYIAGRIADTYNTCNSVYFTGSGGVNKIVPSQSSLLGNGNAVIVFDEISSIAPGGMSPIMTMVGEDGSLEWNGYRYNTAGTVIIFTTDITREMTVKALITAKGKREAIPMQYLRNEVKTTINKLWKDQGVELGKHISEVVPFIDFDKPAVVRILDDHFLKFDMMPGHRNQLWSRLVLTDTVAEYLTSGLFLVYEKYSHKDFKEDLVLSVNGARSLLTDSGALEVYCKSYYFSYRHFINLMLIR